MTKPQKHFTIIVEAEYSFTIDEIWPDGDAPENPTEDDVKKVFQDYGPSLASTANDWGMEFEVRVY